jgi:hypothetical protein
LPTIGYLVFWFESCIQFLGLDFDLASGVSAFSSYVNT